MEGAYPLRNMEASSVARVFVNDFVCRFGVPETLHTDQGRNFESAMIKEICQLLVVRKTRTTPYHPQSDGLVEIFNKTVLEILSMAVQQDEDKWTYYCHLFFWLIVPVFMKQQVRHPLL